MIPKSGNRFSEKIMLKRKKSPRDDYFFRFGLGASTVS